MVGKSSVSALQEFCAKNKCDPPEYEWIEAEDGSFVCEVEILGMSCHGNGRSKRDAKHQAAANVIKKLRLTHPDIDEIPRTPYEETPTVDMIVALRDYCVQRNHPLPNFEIVQQAGTPDAPEFTALCTIATIRRYGVSENKKDARQKAAWEMMRVIFEDDKVDVHKEVATLQARAQEVEEERYQKFKTYRELNESKSSELPGVLLCDRHNHFTKYFEQLKAEAREIFDTPYESHQAQALDILRTLKIKPNITQMTSCNTAERLHIIELNCDYDVVFAGPESIIYEQMVQYFKDML